MRGLNPKFKSAIWKFSQHYATYFNIETEATIVNGMRMRVSSKPRVEQEIVLFGEWEPLFTRYLLSIPPNDDIFLDIGSNIGYFSLIASKIFGSIHAIEASPSTCARLREIVEGNGIGNVHIHQVAVGDTKGHIDFYQDRRQSGAASTIKTKFSVFESRVPMAPISEILHDIEWHRVRFVKLDIEGVEAVALDSLFELRDALHPDVEIFVEFDPERQDVWPAIERFLGHGFSASMMQGTYDRYDYCEPDRQSQLQRVDSPPAAFCDLLLRRSGPEPS